MSQGTTDRWIIALAVATAAHGGFGSGLYAAGVWLDKPSKPPRELVEMEVVERKPPAKMLELPPPPPPPIPEELPEPPAPKPLRPRPTKVATQPPPRTAPPPPQAPTTTEPPAPGENLTDDDLAPKRVYRLESAPPGGSIPVPRGRTTGHARGVPGGTGTNTGGGGPPDSTGTQVARPVSIASIKQRALPKPGQDYIPDFKDFPAEARRLKVGGQVKVKLVVSEQGTVAKATLVKRAGHGFDELALRLARKLEFTPATDSTDQPVSSIVVWTFTFPAPD